VTDLHQKIVDEILGEIHTEMRLSEVHDAATAIEGLFSAALGIAAGAADVGAIVPPHCTGSRLVFDPGTLHVNKDGSGYIAVSEDDFVLEDDREEGPDGPQGSVHWIVSLAASEMAALRNFLNGQTTAPVARVINDNQPGRTAIVEILCEPPTLGVGTPLFAALSQPAPAAGAADVGALREGLKPFAQRADRYDDRDSISIGDSCELWQLERNPSLRVDITVGDLRRARAALSQPPAPAEGWRPSPAGRPEPEISHVDLCHLSRVFCDATGPTSAQDVRINAWIGWHVATAAVRLAKSLPAAPEARS